MKKIMIFLALWILQNGRYSNVLLQTLIPEQVAWKLVQDVNNNNNNNELPLGEQPWQEDVREDYEVLASQMGDEAEVPGVWDRPVQYHHRRVGGMVQGLKPYATEVGGQQN